MLELAQAKQVIAEFGAATLDDPAAQAALMSEVGAAQIALGQFKEAGAAYAKALAAQPGDPRARAGEARLLAIAGDLPGAMKIVDEVLAQSPGNPDALGLKVELLLARNEREPAKQTLAQLVQAEPQERAGALRARLAADRRAQLGPGATRARGDEADRSRAISARAISRRSSHSGRAMRPRRRSRSSRC